MCNPPPLSLSLSLSYVRFHWHPTHTAWHNFDCYIETHAAHLVHANGSCTNVVVVVDTMWHTHFLIIVVALTVVLFDFSTACAAGKGLSLNCWFQHTWHGRLEWMMSLEWYCKALYFCCMLIFGFFGIYRFWCILIWHFPSVLLAFTKPLRLWWADWTFVHI